MKFGGGRVKAGDEIVTLGGVGDQPAGCGDGGFQSPSSTSVPGR